MLKISENDVKFRKIRLFLTITAPVYIWNRNVIIPMPVCVCVMVPGDVNSSVPEQNGRHFADNFFKYIF